MKKILYIFISIIICTICNAQNTRDSSKTLKNISFIENSKIKHEIVLLACDTCVPITNIGYRVRVVLSENENEIIKKLNYENWMSLLSDNNSDWAANLILYNMYNKDAFLLARNDNRVLWITSFKQDDLKYWKKHLTKK